MKTLIDTSAHEPNLIWKNLSPLPDWAIHRATLGDYYVDPYLPDYFNQWQALNIPHGCYVVLQADSDIKATIDLYIRTITLELDGDFGDLPPILDVEDGRLSFAQVLQAVEYIKDQFGIYPLFYTAYYVWKDDIVGSNDPHLISDKCDLWMAQYNSIPDLIPIGWERYGIWQYTDKGKLTGATYDFDFNYISDWYYEKITGNSNEFIEYWFDGKAEYRRGWSIDLSGDAFQYFTVRIPKENIQNLFVTKMPLHPHSTSYIAETRGVDILTNGGEATYKTDPALPKGLSVSEGVEAPKDPDQWFLSMQFDQNNEFLGFAVRKLAGCYWAIGISDVLIENNLIPTDLDNIDAAPRTAWLWNDKEWIGVLTGGRIDGTPGITRKELAYFCKSLGATFGGNCDGGDSSTLVQLLNGDAIIKNELPDGKEHQVADHFGVIIKKDSPMPTKRFECILREGKAARIRAADITGQPSIWGQAVGTYTYPTTIWTDVEPVIKQATGGTKPEAAGTWLNVDVDQKWWTAAVYNNEIFFDVIDHGNPNLMKATEYYKGKVRYNFVESSKPSWRELKTQGVRLIPKSWAEKILYPILPDWDIGWDRPKNRPAIVRTFTLNEYTGGDYNGTNQVWRQEFTEEMQWFWFELCCLQRWGVKSEKLSNTDFTWTAKRFAGGPNSITASDTFLNNKNGTDICKDFINGDISGRPDAKVDLLLCMGSGVNVLNVLTGIVVTNDSNKEMLKFDTIDPNNLPEPSLNLPGIIYATNIHADHVSNFDQLQINGDGCPTPYPLFRKPGTTPYYPLQFLGEIP